MFYEQYLKLCALRGVAPSAAAEAVGVTRKAATGWKNGAEPRNNVKAKLAEYFNVPVSYFEGNSDVEEPVFNARDRRDIAKTMEELKEQLMNEQGLMFDGDPLSPEALESVLSAIQMGIEIAKVKNKEKYTPKKFRKPKE